MTDLAIFNFESHELRVFGDPSDPLFVLVDVCQCLDIGNPRQVAARLDDDEKNTVILNDGTPGNPEKTVVTEPGLYSVILSCRKPQAKPFKRWVTHEVLPTIRKTGSYSLHPEKNKPRNKDKTKSIDDLAKIVKILKDAQTLDPAQKKLIQAEALSILNLTPESRATLQEEEKIPDTESHISAFCRDVGLREHLGSKVPVKKNLGAPETMVRRERSSQD